jgi:hypothetical protein
MTSIMDMLQEHLGDSGVTQLTQHLGVDPSTAQAAAAVALPMLVNAMSNRASQPGAAAMPDASGGGLAGAGGLLGSLFGGNHAQMSQQVSQHSGLDIHQAEKALLFLAPIVMAQLARKRQEGGIPAAPGTAPAAPAPPQSGAAPAQVQGATEEPAAKESALGSVLGAVERIFHGNK